MSNREFRIYHVSRHCAKHNFELDDRLYGSPLQKDVVDWALEDPKLYLKRVANELSRVETAIDDMTYLLREKGEEVTVPEAKEPSLEEADAYVFHKFHVRQFEYVEKLSYQLGTCPPNKMNLIIPKARRQLNVLLAAREDLLTTKVRFENYIKMYQE